MTDVWERLIGTGYRDPWDTFARDDIEPGDYSAPSRAQAERDAMSPAARAKLEQAWRAQAEAVSRQRSEAA